MVFYELWEKVPGLSDLAKKQVPDALSMDTKERLEQYSPFEIGVIVRSAINEIEHGDTETVDELVRKQIYKGKCFKIINGEKL